MAGRGAHEDLDPRLVRQAFPCRKLLRIRGGRADIEGMIAPHAMMAAPDFVLQPLRAIRVGAGVRHFENGRHPAQHSGAAARFEVFLMLKARLAEMHLTVDDARQNIRSEEHTSELKSLMRISYAV